MAYTTAADVKTYLAITGVGDDALITLLIARAQAAIDTLLGRTFEASSDSTRKYSPVTDVDRDTLYLDGDLCQITTVKTNADNPAGATTIPSTAYITAPRYRTPYYAIRIVDTDYSWEYYDIPENGIEITGRWAWSVTAPADIVQACTRLAAYFYRQRDAQVFDVTAQPELGQMVIPQGIPADVRALLAPYARIV